MSNNNRVHKIKQQTLNCTLAPWDNYKTNKFTDRSTGSRLSTIKSCAGKGTANGTFKGKGRMNSQGYSNVQNSSSRTLSLASIICNCTKKS